MDLQLSRNRSFWSWALIFYMTLILALSLKPAVNQPQPTSLQETLHNFCHAPAYAGLTFLVIGLLYVYRIKSAVFLKAFCFSLLYGILMEFLQGFAPGRTPSLGDVLLNASGSGIMIILIQKGFMRKVFDI